MFGQTHRRVIGAMPAVFTRSGMGAAATLITNNLATMQDGVASPDSDNTGLKIPDNLLPAALKIYNVKSTLPAWEHGLPNDMPPTLTAIFKAASPILLGRPFRWADDTIVAWYADAVATWGTNQTQALYKIARCCHLIEDLTVPFHDSVRNNISEAFLIFTAQYSDHQVYEGECEKAYSPLSTQYTPVKITNLKAEMQRIAAEGRVLYHTFNFSFNLKGVSLGLKQVVNTVLNSIQKAVAPVVAAVVTTVQNVVKAITTKVAPQLSTSGRLSSAVIKTDQRAEQYTANLLYTFFKDVHVL